MKVDVLDKGFVEKMMCADSDLTVVNCARVSFGKESSWEYKPREPGETGPVSLNKLSDRDTKLIHYLARNNHWTPFAHPIIRLRVKAPIFIRTQLFKHKFGAVENEVSRRYVDDPPEFYCPEKWRKRPEGSVKQGSGEAVVDRSVNFLYDGHMLDAQNMYDTLLNSGFAPEQARAVLPQSTYTEWIWTGSLAFFARVYKQRSDPHAQKEAQDYAHAIGEIMKPLFPISWEALTNGS
jgi:thymidylate synthase (FAD)